MACGEVDTSTWETRNLAEGLEVIPSGALSSLLESLVFPLYFLGVEPGENRDPQMNPLYTRPHFLSPPSPFCPAHTSLPFSDLMSQLPQYINTPSPSHLQLSIQSWL